MALIICAECESQVSDKAAACPKCGAPVSSTTQIQPFQNTVQIVQPQHQSAQPPISHEMPYLMEAGIEVSSARFIVNGQTYAIRNITSVRKDIKQAPKVFWTILAIIFGICTYGSTDSGAIGGFVIATIVCIAIAALLKHSYFVSLTTSASEVKALESKDEKYIDRIIDALNKAIIHQSKS